MRFNLHRLLTVATISIVAIVVLSCKQETAAEAIDFETTPVQIADSIFTTNSKNGVILMRMEAPRMEKYDMTGFEKSLYPDGLKVFAYTDEGLLETEIRSLHAIYTRNKKTKEEEWKLFGEVYVRNVINDQIMTTDTLYWDQVNERIHTDCYVKLTSPQGLLQGYGMESDQKANNSVILKPFDSFGVNENDSTKVYIDTVNFIGPMQRKRQVVAIFEPSLIENQ